MIKRYAMATSIVAALGMTGVANAEGTGQSAQHEQGQQQQGQQQQGQQATQPRQDAKTQQGQQAQTAEQASGQATAGTNLYALSNQQVRQLQRRLQEQGLYQGNVDGIVGPLTRSALRSFQEQEGIDAPGVWNERTAAALGIQTDRQPVSGTDQSGAVGQTGTDIQRQPGIDQGGERIQLSALSSDQVQDLQQRLQEMGHYRGEIDGIVGPQTRSALRQFFQRQAQLAGQGMLSDTAISVFGMSPEDVQPVRGEDEPAQGMDQPSQGMDQPTEGQESQGQPAQGADLPAEGQDQLLGRLLDGGPVLGVAGQQLVVGHSHPSGGQHHQGGEETDQEGLHQAEHASESR